MEFPISCRQALERLMDESGVPLSVLQSETKLLTQAYKEDSGHGARLVIRKSGVLAYAAVRMPATFGAVSTALDAALQTLSDADIASLSTVLDLGAGTGAASLAICECLPAVTAVTAVEREPEMRAVGQQMTHSLPVTWEAADALAYVRRCADSGRVFDVVITSYMTNEMDDESRSALFSLLCAVTGKLLLLVEPGTKTGSAILIRAREFFLASGLEICAPCPAVRVCPLPADDWCHFTCRVARSRLHKLLKGGDVPYEDEKFSYLALTHLPYTPCGARILRHPIKESGRITLTLCSPAGHCSEVVTKRDKARFTAARKSGAGDSI